MARKVLCSMSSGNAGCAVFSLRQALFPYNVMYFSRSVFHGSSRPPLSERVIEYNIPLSVEVCWLVLSALTFACPAVLSSPLFGGVDFKKGLGSKVQTVTGSPFFHFLYSYAVLLVRFTEMLPHPPFILYTHSFPSDRLWIFLEPLLTPPPLFTSHPLPVSLMFSSLHVARFLIFEYSVSILSR